MSPETTKKYPKRPVLYMARMIHQSTGGGRALVEFLLDVAEGRFDDASVRDRLDAVKFLVDHGYGRAPQAVEVHGTVQHQVGPGYDLSKLSDAELAVIRASLDKAKTAEDLPQLPGHEDETDAEIEG